MLIQFIFLAIVAILATACVAKVAYMTTQPGMIFGGWQHVLNRMNDANSRVANWLYRPLGGCELCFAHAWGVLSFIGFVCFINYIAFPGFWTVHWSFMSIVANVAFYLMYVCTSTVVSTMCITRL